MTNYSPIRKQFCLANLYDGLLQAPFGCD